MEESF